KDEVTPLTGLVMHRLKSEDLADRLFAGEIVSTTLDDREIAVGIARRQLFVVAILGATTIDDVKALRFRVSRCLPDPEPLHMTADPSDGSGPADLPLIEYGITVRRDRG